MKATIENQKTNEVELAHLFEVEGLEERMEFGRWAVTGDGTSGTCSDGECSGKYKVGFKIYF